tara:strand:+ start:99 stop:830 length:732 start_codon:yes stop_codon:yes gene_type:complete
MNDTLDNEHQNNSGQINDNVGQDVSGQEQENSTNWESQAKYFQSEKDKLHAENQNLKQYEQVGRMLEARPDIVKEVTSMLQGGKANQQEKITLDKDDFDPWEAYNDPASQSYKFRQQELQESINGAVQESVQGIKKQVGMSNLQNELKSRGLGQEEINSFIEFADKNPAEYGIDGAINMWQAVTNGSEAQKGTQASPLDSIRQNQQVPQQAGILNGQQPVQTNEDSDKWKSVLGASRVGNKIP